MGLMDLDIERVERKQRAADQQYRYGSSALRKEAAPDEAAVKAYNTQVEGFKSSAVSRDNGNDLWNIVGWVSANPGYEKVVAHDLSLGGSQWYHGGAGNMYRGSFSSNSGGGWYWGDTDKATIRSATDGTPLSALPANNSESPSDAGMYYASWNDKPFVAPITQEQKTEATAADTRLKDVGTRGEGLMAEHAAATQRTEKEADRLAMTPGIGDNTTSAPRSDAFADTNVFQSIVDWLK